MLGENISRNSESTFAPLNKYSIHVEYGMAQPAGSKDTPLRFDHFGVKITPNNARNDQQAEKVSKDNENWKSISENHGHKWSKDSLFAIS